MGQGTWDSVQLKMAAHSAFEEGLNFQSQVIAVSAEMAMVIFWGLSTAAFTYMYGLCLHYCVVQSQQIFRVFPTWAF